MEIVFLISAGIVIFYIWTLSIKSKDRLRRKKRERAKQWKKKSRKQRYGR